MFFGGDGSPAVGVGGEAPGDRIDGYRLIEVIGEGGFGTVWKAEQETPVRRFVALKVIKAGMDTKAVIARFESERQALALMNHRSIAAVYGAGSTARGRPYFVMELVPGISITKHCARAKLSTRARLELFREVCTAVHHAHMKGIIHRDISAANVLASEAEGGRTVVKIIDFGLAKATAHRLTERTLYTEQGMIVGNPEYMSPEQAETGAQDIDTRTDIYSLGVLLYEMLTGELPFGREELRRLAFEEIQRIIREIDPPRPSTRVSQSRAENLGVEPGEASRELRRELEWIPLRAMRKNRGERYQSAAELAEDVGNYLEGRALRAGPPSVWYQARKFVRRHRSGVLVSGVVLSTVIGATVFSAWSWARAVRSNRVSDGVVAFSRDEVFGAIADDSGPSPLSKEARTMFVEAIGPAARKISNDSGISDPWLRRRLHGLLGAVYKSLWEFPRAQEHYETALRLAESAGGADDEELVEYKLGRGESLFRQSNSESVKVLEGVIAWQRDRLGEDEPEVLDARNLLGGAYKNARMFDKARAEYTEVLVRRRRVLGDRHLDVFVTQVNLALTDLEEGRAVRDGGDGTRAEALLRSAERDLAAVIAKLREFHPSRTNAARAEAERGRALMALGRDQEAEESLRSVSAELEQKLGGGHPLTLVTLASLGRLRVKQERWEEARELYAKAAGEFVRIQGPQDNRSRGMTLDYAVVLVKLGENDKADQVLNVVFRGLKSVNDTALAGEFAKVASERLKGVGAIELAGTWEQRAKTP
jgi:serine/threonine protein kinase